MKIAHVKAPVPLLAVEKHWQVDYVDPTDIFLLLKLFLAANPALFLTDVPELAHAWQSLDL